MKLSRLAMLLCFTAIAQQSGPDAGAGTSPAATSGYILGPGDQITIRMADVEEINEKPVTIDVNGFLRLPLVGRLRAAGLSLTEFETELSDRYQTYLVRPDVSVSVSAFRSQPVSVVGAVKTPGIYQVEGRRTIFEMLSLAGGLDPAAGATLNITRRLEYGRIPLPSAEDNATGEFSVANVRLKSIMSATNPEENIAVMPHDVITVPRAEIVYVIGEVQKAGGFTLNEQEHMTILQALSLAGGLAREASSKNAKILRAASAQTKREELPVNVKAILDGKAPDVTMKPEDILFVPSSQPKRAAARAAEAAIQVATGVIIWRR